MPDEVALSAASVFAIPTSTARFTGVQRASGTLEERPDPEKMIGGFYLVTDANGGNGLVCESTGKSWIVRGALSKEDMVGQMSGTMADMPPAAKCIGWVYHVTDTGEDCEAFPDGGDGVWYHLNPLAPALQSDNLSETVDDLKGPGLAKLRSKLTPQYGTRLKSTGDDATLVEQRFVIFQTIDASPRNPIMVSFDQFILESFTGDGQFDLVERDSIRRVFDGACAGGTGVITSDTMEWTEDDEGASIKVGLNPGRHYRILTFDAPNQVTLSNDITLPSSGLTLTMDGRVEDEVTIATKAGFTDGVATGDSSSRLMKALQSDKVYSVVFAPGTTGDGIYSITARALYPIDPDQTPAST